MKPKLKTILFITSFIPVIVFKVVARVGDATLAQAKVATVVGLILAGIQFILSSKIYQAYNLFRENLSRVPWVWDDMGLFNACSGLFLICRSFYDTSLFCTFLDNIHPSIIRLRPFHLCHRQTNDPGDGLEYTSFSNDQSSPHLFLECYLLCQFFFKLAGTWKASIFNPNSINHHFGDWPSRGEDLPKALPKTAVCLSAH